MILIVDLIVQTVRGIDPATISDASLDFSLSSLRRPTPQIGGVSLEGGDRGRRNFYGVSLLLAHVPFFTRYGSSCINYLRALGDSRSTWERKLTLHSFSLSLFSARGPPGTDSARSRDEHAKFAGSLFHKAGRRMRVLIYHYNNIRVTPVARVIKCLITTMR